MLIYSILMNEKKNLKFLGKSDENIELIGTQITEFKKHGISVDLFKDEINNTEDKYLKCKMQDMLLVYEKFQNNLKDKYIDENDVLTILAEKIEETDFFNDSVIYIDEFVGFTKQEYAVIRKLLK
ncbi:MAG: helicase-exonuclease AddAB subunit AddB, partial [Clostridia bacterium]|nr:helicase-exonuclease AddAB subunit AddB [Clostridia bacterium]